MGYPELSAMTESIKRRSNNRMQRQFLLIGTKILCLSLQSPQKGRDSCPIYNAASIWQSPMVACNAIGTYITKSLLRPHLRSTDGVFNRGFGTVQTILERYLIFARIMKKPQIFRIGCVAKLLGKLRH